VLGLAERLGMTTHQVLASHTSAELSEWMAYELLKSSDFVEKLNKEVELENFRKLSDAEQAAAFKRAIRGSNG
jgi:hypothetical protein